MATKNSAIPLDAILATIRTSESGSAAGNYQAHAKKGSASGAYQYVDSTWRTELHKAGLGNLIAQYPSAYLAPKAIQDQVAANNVKNILAAHGGRIEAVPRVWYLGHDSSGKAEDNIVPAPQMGNNKTPAQYASSWLKVLGKQSNNPISRITNAVTNAVNGTASLYGPQGTSATSATTGVGTPQMMGAPGQVAPIDIASIIAQAGQLANQQVPNLPDIGQATNAYQASVQAALAQQLQNLDAQFAAGQKALTDRGAIFDQQRQQTLANVTSQGAQTQAALGALTAPSVGAQSAQDAAQNAGRAGYGFGALAGTTGGLENVASAGAQQIAGATSDMQKMMEQDMANIGKLIQTQGASDLTLGKLQMQGQAQQQAATAVSNYIAAMNAERVKALTDYALSTPQRQQQFASLLMGGAQSNQDAQSKNVSNAMAVQQNNTNNYNDFLKLQAQLADSRAGRAASLADSAAGRAQSQFNADRNYALDLKQFDEQVRVNEARILKSGASTIGGLSAKDNARVATAVSAIDAPTMERVAKVAQLRQSSKNIGADFAALGSPAAVAQALALAAYDPKILSGGDADGIMRQVAAAMSQSEVKAGATAKTSAASRADAIYKDMKAMYNNIALTDIPQARAYMDQMLTEFPLRDAVANGQGASLGQMIGGLASQAARNFGVTPPRPYGISQQTAMSTALQSIPIFGSR